MNLPNWNCNGYYLRFHPPCMQQLRPSDHSWSCLYMLGKLSKLLHNYLLLHVHPCTFFESSSEIHLIHSPQQSVVLQCPPIIIACITIMATKIVPTLCMYPPLLIAHSNVQPSFHPPPHHFHSCNTNQYRNMKRHSQVLPPDASVPMPSCNLGYRDSNMLYCGWLWCICPHRPQYVYFLYIFYISSSVVAAGVLQKGH